MSDLPEFLREDLPPALTDLEIVEAKASELEPPDTPARGVLWRAAPGAFWFEVPGVARFLVEGGTRMSVAADPRANVEQVAGIARATPRTAVFLQRGLVALHAAAVRVDGRAIVVTGDSGSGKSVLLAELIGRGAQPLGDDLTVLRTDAPTGVRVVPNERGPRLWISTPKTSDDGATPGRLDPDEPPIGQVWSLTTTNHDTVETVEETGAARFTRLLNSAYNSRVTAAVLGNAPLFAALAPLTAGSVPFQILRQPRGRSCTAELADLVLGARTDGATPGGISHEARQ